VLSKNGNEFCVRLEVGNGKLQECDKILSLHKIGNLFFQENEYLIQKWLNLLMLLIRKGDICQLLSEPRTLGKVRSNL
jgi:hypothetical protein